MPVRDQVNDMIDFEARLQALKIRRKVPGKEQLSIPGRGQLPKRRF